VKVAERPQPGVVVEGPQLPGPRFERGPLGTLPGKMRRLTLSADVLGTGLVVRTSMLLKPVGQHQARRVLFGGILHGREQGKNLRARGWQERLL
jgi:hypothetical protein